MSNLTQRGPNANASAKLPSLQAARAQDPNVQKALEALREWVEVRLGARGDRFERAVTFRDLDSELDALRTGLEAAIANAGSSASTTTSAGASDADLAAIQTTINALRNTVAALDGSVSSRIAAANAAIEVLTALVNTKGDFSSNTATSVDGEIVLFSGTAGKTGKRATGSGYAKVTSGVLGLLTVDQARADLGEKVVTLTDAATILVDAALGNNFRVVLGGNRTLGNPLNLIDGQVINFRIKQDGGGGRTLAYSSMYKFPGGTAPVLSTAANALDFMSCQYDAADGTLVCVLTKDFK